MENQLHQEDPTPPGCFKMAELEELQSFEQQVLTQVNYYFWSNQTEGDAAPYQFLFYLELVFEDLRSLLLTSGEDTEAIRVSDAETLVKTAGKLQALHQKTVIQRVAAAEFPLWAGVRGKTLSAIRLSKNDQGLYANDALLLDFGQETIMVQLSPQEGLELRPYP